jgi:hypothetical protein
MNKFKANEIKLIKKAKQTYEKVSLMQKPDGTGMADWYEDWVCYPGGRKLKLFFSKWVDNSQNSRFDLVRVFAMEYVSRNLSPLFKVGGIQAAVRIIGLLECELCDVEQSDINSVHSDFKRLSYKHDTSFWIWCKKNKLIPDFLNTPTHKDNRNKSPEEYEERQKKFLILDEQVAAVGVAFNELFSEVGISEYGFKAYPREYIALAFCALALSTPSRANAEIWALPNQKIKTHLDGETGNETHSLFWKGSKKHPDNRTHILSELKDKVDRVFEVLEKEFTPGKILSFFMTNPSLSLNEVMKQYSDFEYKVDDYPRLNLDSPANIFHLGLILGLYDEEPIVPVLSQHDANIPIHLNQTWKVFKYLSDIKNDEEIGAHHTVIYLFRKSKDIKPGVAWHAYQSHQKAWFGDAENTTLSKLTSFVIKANKSLNGSVDTIVRGRDVSTKVADAFFVPMGSDVKGSLKSNGRNSHTVASNIPVPTMYELDLSDKRPEVTKVWIGKALRLVGLEKMAFSPHLLRHWINHHAKESGIPISIINLWSGRKDADQAYEYIHTTDEDNAKQISSVLVKKEDIEPASDIKLISIDKVKNLRKLPASIMSEGICTQDLVTMPCRFLNDFMTSCFGCQAMCYINGDAKALKILKMDLDIQMRRLAEVQAHEGFNVNKASQEWHKTHFNKTSVLKALIDILEDDAIPNGSTVRMVGDLTSLEFRVQNLETGQIAVRKLVLEDSSKSLKGLLEKACTKRSRPNDKLLQLLSSHGVSNV